MFVREPPPWIRHVPLTSLRSSVTGYDSPLRLGQRTSMTGVLSFSINRFPQNLSVEMRQGSLLRIELLEHSAPSG